ncbi:hypothetical protein R1flu_024563 [Riccia fluitans]|uniref:Uncharacterized protein n=1 Tax=Riccia fluitans TaxID=41844 RepID=A0ABD1XY80_9MARC
MLMQNYPNDHSGDCRLVRGNLERRDGEKAFFEQLMPFAYNSSLPNEKHPNMNNKLWLNSALAMEEQSLPPVSSFHLPYAAKVKTMPVNHGYRKYDHVTGENNHFSRSTNNPRYPDCPSSDVDMEHRDAVVAACHLLLLSNSLQINRQAGGLDCHGAENVEDAVQMIGQKYTGALRDRFEEDSSDSFTRASVTSASLSPSSNDCRSYASLRSHDEMGTESSSGMMVSDSTEVTSNNNSSSTPHAVIRKRKKKTNDRLLADIVGQERESEVLDRPARKRRYRSLSDLLRRVH